MYEHIPQALKDNEPFCLWRSEDGRKILYQISGMRADPSDPSTFAGFDDVKDVMDDSYSGIGVLTTTFTKIDIDHCVNDGKLTPFAEEIVNAVGSYTELSPSGSGVHIICYTPGIDFDRNRYYFNNRKCGLEVYVPGATNRFFTVTGDVIRGTDIEERTSAVQELLEKYIRRPDVNNTPIEAPGSYLSDESVIEKARSSKQGWKFEALWNGEWHAGYGSQSEADLALTSTLAFWCGGDSEQMDRLFRRSALYRPKWDEKHGAETYGDMTISKAVRMSAAFYSPVKASAEEDFNELVGRLAELSPETNQRYRSQDIGCGRLFADIYKGIARYVPERKLWFVYDDTRWIADTGSLKVMELCKDLSDALFIHLTHIKDEDVRKEFFKFCGKWQLRRNREIYLKDAQSVYPIPAAEFDTDIYLYNVRNGTLDLTTMKFRKHDPEDRITKLADVEYDADAKSDRFDSFIDEIMSGDREKALYMQKSLGYALSGDTRHECMFFLYGETTRNGKSTLMESVLRTFGDYGAAVQPETIAQKNIVNSHAPTEDIARLAGRRLVNISEPKRGLVINSAQVKNMSGNDTITARFLHEKSFEFKPQFSLYINTNYLPDITDMTLFESNRVNIIPFERHFEEWEQDKKLKAEFVKPEVKSAILNWLIEGYRLLNKEGFKTPASVRAATETYSQESNRVKIFMDDRLIEDGASEVKTADVYIAYKSWCADNGCYPENSKHFTQALRQIGNITRKRPQTGGEKTTLLIGYRIAPEEFL